MKLKTKLSFLVAALACAAIAPQSTQAGDMPVTQGSYASLRGRVSGSFNDSWFSFATINLTWKF